MRLVACEASGICADAARAHKDAVECAVPEHGCKRIKSARKTFRKRKRHKHHCEAQKYLREGKPIHFIKAQEHEADGQKRRKRNKELADRRHDKRRFVFHLAAQMN